MGRRRLGDVLRLRGNRAYKVQDGRQLSLSRGSQSLIEDCSSREELEMCCGHTWHGLAAFEDYFDDANLLFAYMFP